jgi:hypothetical protein
VSERVSEEAITVEVKIGVRDAPREVVLESEDSPEAVTKAVEDAVTNDGLLRLTDDRGRTVLVPGKVIAYVEMGVPESRRVGFGGR